MGFSAWPPLADSPSPTAPGGTVELQPWARTRTRVPADVGQGKERKPVLGPRLLPLPAGPGLCPAGDGGVRSRTPAG